MAVAFFGSVAAVQATDAVVVAASGFSESIGEGEAKVAPVVIAGGYVNAGLLDARGDGFNVFKSA